MLACARYTTHLRTKVLIRRNSFGSGKLRPRHSCEVVLNGGVNNPIIAGGNLIVDTPIIVRARDNPTLWLTKDDDGRDLLNIDLRNADGTPISAMQDNDWLAYPTAMDVVAPPQRRSLFIKSKSASVCVRMQFSSEPSRIAHERILEAAGRFRPYIEKTLIQDNLLASEETMVCKISCDVVRPLSFTIRPRVARVGGAILSTSNLVRMGAVFDIESSQKT